MPEQQQESVESQQQSEGDEFKPITSQDDFNKALGARLAAERKKVEAQFADYGSIKSELDGFKALADDSKTETDKLREQLDAIQEQRNADRLEATRLRVANTHGITDAEDLALLTGSTEELLNAQAARIAALHSTSKKNGNHVAREGTSAVVSATPRDQFAALIRGQLNTE